MAESSLDPEVFSCPICLEILKDPVTIPCGHSYCMKCIKQHWNQSPWCTCSQCNKCFSPRPVLVKNIMLVDLAEQLKKTELSESPPAGPHDVPCDMCPEKKLKAVKFCLWCVASFCDRHIQPHYDAAVFQSHQLVLPSKKLQENICSKHNRLKEIFCCNDQQLICSFCVDQHQGHCTVSSATERAKKQAELPALRTLLLQRIQDKEADLERLQQEAQDIIYSAQTALQLSGDIFKEMAVPLEKRRSQVEQQIRSEEQNLLRQVQELQEILQQDVQEMKRSISELETLSLKPDHSRFLQLYASLSTIKQRAEPRIQTRTPCNFKDVITAVSLLRDKLKVTLEEDSSQPHLLQSATELPIRENFLQYSSEIILDPNTANNFLSLSDANRSATLMDIDQGYPDHPDRFSYWSQVLSSNSLTGCCYWEVVWSGARIGIAVSYKDIQRKGGGNKCRFGFNDKSWMLDCDKNGYLFKFNSTLFNVSGPVSSRVGVYLDHSAGILSFYSIQDQIMTCLHRVQTTFSQPLYAGIKFYDDTNSTAQFPQLK